MAYTKTVWETGDVITAAKLNNAENGIKAANDQIYRLHVVVTMDGDNPVFTPAATYSDVLSAVATASIVSAYFTFNDSDDIDSAAYFAGVTVDAEIVFITNAATYYYASDGTFTMQVS